MRITIVATAAALLALAGCEGGTPAPKGNAAAPAAEANAVADAAPDPANEASLRALLPPYPGATRVRDGLGGGGTSGSFAFATSDPTRPVIDFYAAAARRAGYAVEVHEPVGIALSMTATNAEGALANVTASRVGQVTEVQAMASLGTR